MKIMFALVAFTACSSNHHAPIDSAPIVDAPPAPPLARAVAGDFNAGHPGILSTVDPETHAVMQNVAPQGAVADDPVVRHIGSELFVVNRNDGNSVTILDASTYALVEQLGTGASSNPQDVAVVDNRLYVPALGTTGVVVLTRGSTATTTIDLGTPLADPDGKPDCVSAYIVGAQLFVVCGLLDENFQPRGPGKIAVVDITTNAVTTTFALPFANPQGFFEASPMTSLFGGDLLIPVVPSFSDYTTGCIARVSATAASCAITNQQLGGYAARLDVANETLWLAVDTLDSNFMNPTGLVRPFDLQQGGLGTRLSATTELIVDLAACPDGSVVASDQTKNAAGLRVYAHGGETTTVPLAIGLPPGFGDNLVCY